MTIETIISSGSGTLNARWEIEGLPIQIVTDPAMEKTISGGSYDGVERICCTSLEDCGFSIEETGNLPEAKLEALSTSLMLWETVDEDLSNVFHHRPDVERYCAVTFSDSATTITLLSTTGISAGDVLHIGTEAIKVGAVSSPNLTGCTRAMWGTIARKHWASDTAGVPELLVTNRPIRFRGRRVKLYLYGDGDDLTGDGGNSGTPYWRGFVTTEPRLLDSGGRYQLSLGPIIDVLDAKLGGDLDDPAMPRGIYYPWSAALRIEIDENLSSGGPNRIPAAGAYPLLITGFWENQADFVADLNTSLATATSGFDSTYKAIVTEDGLWTIRVTVGSLTTSVRVYCSSPTDGESSPIADQMLIGDARARTVDAATLASGNRLYPNWWTGPAGARSVPRGHYTMRPYVSRRHWDPTTAATWPAKRIYLDRAVQSDWTAASMSWPGGDNNVGSITTADTTDNYIELELGPRENPRDPPRAYIYTAQLGVEALIQREILSYAANVDEFRDALLTEAISYADLGTCPFVTSDDLADWTTVVDEAAGTPFQKKRKYFLATPTDLLEMLSQEWRILGVFPMTESDGKIGLRKIDIPNATRSDLTDMTEEVATVDGQPVALSVLSRGNQTVNRVVMKTGYDPVEESWRGERIAVDKTSQSLDHSNRELLIEPRSQAFQALSAEELGAVCLPVLSLFGYPHDFWSVKVPWTYFDLRLGSGVIFDASHLPDYVTGKRGITDVVGIVTGRKWAFNQAYGELTILVPWQNVAGYSPTARITSTVDNGGDHWELTIDSAKYAPVDSTGAAVALVDTFFAVNDKIRVINIDSESATVHTGTIDSINTVTHVLGVQFDATFTASGTQEVIFSPLGTSGLQEDQEKFCAFAGSDLLLGPDNESPRHLGA